MVDFENRERQGSVIKKISKIAKFHGTAKAIF